MSDKRLFVVTVASEKGGVGKTTIATNLAVYLKALREDLPVTVASFDNHFSVDSMFAIGSHRGLSVAGLFEGASADEMVRMGEYGVQFLASARQLTPPDDDPEHLKRSLATSGLTGLLILDTRPILDYFTRNAIAASDLILVPVKDRPSLANAAALYHLLQDEEGGSGRVWLLPSIVDARLRLRDGIGVHDFLTFAARERGYQVLDNYIAKSPKVEGLATSFSSRVYPVLTHARSTAVHAQLRKLADFVLKEFDENRSLPVCRLLPLELPPGRAKRLVKECPHCGHAAAGGEGAFFFDMRSRRRGFVHGDCLSELIDGTIFHDFHAPGTMLVLDASGPGFADSCVTTRLFAPDGEELLTEYSESPEVSIFLALQEGCAGRSYHEFQRETLFVYFPTEPPVTLLTDAGYRSFNALRRNILREIATLAR